MSEIYDNLVDNVKQAYSEMVGDEKETQLSRKVEQAASFRYTHTFSLSLFSCCTPSDNDPPSASLGLYRRQKRKTTAEDGEEVEEEEVASPDGPSAIVLVKQPQNAWEAMKARLSDSPLIQELLKNSRKFQKAAGTLFLVLNAQ